MTQHPPSTKITSRSLHIDIIRVTAMLMVIAMHTVFNFTERTDFFGTKLWFLLEPFMALSKTCVLLFFMLSGYLVISKQRSIHENWQKVKRRLLIPLVFFTCLTVVYILFTWSRGDDWTLWSFIQAQLVRMTSFPSSPLWFLGVLVIFYLLNPLWYPIFNHDQKPDVARYLTTLALIFSLSAHFIQFPALKNGIFFTSFTGWLAYLFFYFYGGLIRNKWITYQNQKMNLLMILFGVLLTVLGDWYTGYIRYHQFTSTWAGYTTFLSLPVVLTAIGIFNLLISMDLSWLNSKAGGRKATTIIVWFADLSFGIYLIHTFVVSLFTDVLGFNFDNVRINVYLYNVLNYLLVLGVSTVIAFGVRKIEKVKKVIGE